MDSHPRKYNRLKVALIEQGKTQAWLAEQLGITVRQVNSYCCNSMQPSVPTLYKIASILGTKVTDLLIDGDKIPTND